MDKPWTDLITTFGLATTILVALALGAWRVLTWAGREIVIPARDHLLLRTAKFFDRLDEMVRRLDDGVAAMRDNLESQTDALGDMKDSAARQTETLNELKTLLQRNGGLMAGLDRQLRDEVQMVGSLRLVVDEVRREISSLKTARGAGKEEQR